MLKKRLTAVPILDIALIKKRVTYLNNDGQKQQNKYIYPVKQN